MGSKLSRCGGGLGGGMHAARGAEYGGINSNKIIECTTTPYDDQKPGTSGLRKKTKVFMQKNYVANFAQSVLDCLPENEKIGGTLLISGDGRYYTTEALREICCVAAGNGIGRVWIGQHGLASTPACSAIIREREKGVCFGGFILTASHNPGGIDQDFGIKFDTANGAPAQEKLMAEVYEKSKKICRIRRYDLPQFPLDKIGVAYDRNNEFMIEIIDSIEDWMNIMHRCFDFSAIKKLFTFPSFTFLYDAMHGVSGPYAKKLFLHELQANSSSLMRADPKPDFGGEHPDPNLTYAKELVQKMKIFTSDEADENTPLFGAAGDGDCDRNMILGRGIFVTPSDSVAIIALYADKCIPFFFPSSSPNITNTSSDKNIKRGGDLKGFARSMPTSQALDQVAHKLGKELYETPTGWKYFSNLMDADKISICGEESFGTGSIHVREKDGLWAVLAWLSILAYRNNCFSNNNNEERKKEEKKMIEEGGEGVTKEEGKEKLKKEEEGEKEEKEGEKEKKKEEEGKKEEESNEEKKKEEKEEKNEGFVTVKQIVQEFWEEFGRTYYCRYDYENKDSDAANKMMKELEETAEKFGKTSEELMQCPAAAAVDKELLQELPLEKMDIFQYEDPVDKQITKNQGIRLFIKNGGRIVWRLSGTGSTGATIRIYMERLVKDKDKLFVDTKEMLQSVASLALQFCRIKEIVGTDIPTVVT